MKLELELVAQKVLEKEEYKPLLFKHQYSLSSLSESIFMRQVMESDDGVY